ncbi:MAG: hypothetical protein ACLQBX_00480 [Candidatus Limnocylindrales bacterium]
MDGLTRRYDEIVALRDPLGKYVRISGFVRRNSPGKTTTVRIVLGVPLADAREVRWARAPITFAARRPIDHMRPGR